MIRGSFPEELSDLCCPGGFAIEINGRVYIFPVQFVMGREVNRLKLVNYLPFQMNAIIGIV